ncbi:MAG TPA: hypothetical protein VGB84_07935 [Arachidicoccus sp.]
MNKRLTKIGILSFGLLLGIIFRSNAQSASASRSNFTLGVGPEAGLPLGDFKDAFKWSLGGSVQADFAIVKKDLYVVVNAGFDNFFGKDNNFISADGKTTSSKDLRIIPAQAGLKYYFPTTNLYIQGTAGAGFLTNKNDIEADKSASFIYSPQIGYLFALAKKNYLDVGVKFQGNSKIYDAGKSYNYLGLRVAYNFGL